MGQRNQNQPVQLQSQQQQGPAALALSCISASAAELATYPIDAIKTQLQLKQSTAPTSVGSSTKPVGAFQLARQLVLQGNGLSGLYAGLTPAVLRHIIYTGMRVTLYEHFKTAYAAHRQAQAHPLLPSSSSSSSSSSTIIVQDGPDNPHAAPAAAPMWAGLLFALTAGAVGQLVAVPADLIKVQMQADVRAVMSGRQQQRHFSSIRSVASALILQHGIAGLWRGGLPAVQRAALVNLGELSTYDTAKQSITQSQLLPPGLPTHLAASVCSGFVSAVISTPVDVLKTRLMAQAVAAPERRALSNTAGAREHPAGLQCSQQCSSNAGSSTGSSGSTGSNSSTPSSRPSSSRCAGSTHYRGMVDCAVQTVRQEGVWAMYKGFWPTWARLGPWQLVFWVTYEQLRSLAGIKGF